MFLSRNKKNNVYPCKPQFYYIKVGFKWVKTIWPCFRDAKILCTIYLLKHLVMSCHECLEHFGTIEMCSRHG